MKKFLCKLLHCCPDKTPTELAWAKLRDRVAPQFRVYLTERFSTNPTQHVFEVVIDLNDGQLISTREASLDTALTLVLAEYNQRT